ncbi:MAG: RibD family protein [Cyanobacteria bacterium J06634_6]
MDKRDSNRTASDTERLSRRPHITVVLAMSADGKISDAHRAPARFPSKADKAHLERQVANADATLFGASTLRAYGTTLSVTDKGLITERRSRQQPDQPIQIVCSATGNLDPTLRFFQQPIPRWLITTLEGMQFWQSGLHGQTATKRSTSKPFDHILLNERPFNWHTVMQDLKVGKSALSAAANRAPIQRLLIMGGGELVASLLADDLVDELYLTICPLIIGGKTAPTPVGGLGFTLPRTPQLTLQSSRTEKDEIFLHYKIQHSGKSQPDSAQ